MTDYFPWWVLAAGAVSFVVGGYYALLAFSNLSEYGLQNMVRTFFWWPKIYARHQHFTEKGWRYRNRAIVFSSLFPAAFLIFLFRSCGSGVAA